MTLCVFSCKKKDNALNGNKGHAQIPEWNRFNKTILDEKLYEPTELVVLDDNRVIYITLHGEVRLYNPNNKQRPVKLIANLSVYDQNEHGLMGVGIDPKFNENHWVYLYYAATSAQWGADTTQHLSRFKFDSKRDTLLMNTEEVLLRIATKRGCCHTGGSIAWDKAGNLYLSTGDDTEPSASGGYAPIDNREGRKGWDALSSASNTNDLKGKILRIKPRPDKGYDIPEGNLFPPGTKKTRPEIYVMGNRNPYRISVDQHTGYLYWGEVGPDAGIDSIFGPRGYDEINQARGPGYFGWPLFVADNKPYHNRNFITNKTGGLFDPLKPANNSPNNTGLIHLPAAKKAFIWYPYSESPDFGPVVGKGGRNAMAGPVYYIDDYPKDSQVKFPAYFDGKLFTYDWMRDWIMTVTLKPNGDFASMERFLPEWNFSHVMDMQFAKDGSLFILEYGQLWYSQNDEARLSRITFNTGNRAPLVKAQVNKDVGAVPLKALFTSIGSLDYDGDKIKYEWTIGEQKFYTASVPYTFTKSGIYKPVLKITDTKGNSSETHLVVKAGNESPHVDIAIKGNKTFYFNKQAITYNIEVSDKEDGSLNNGKISPDDVSVGINYIEGFDKAAVQGHQVNNIFTKGKRLIELSDCKGCHDINKKSVGPSFIEIAHKYYGDYNAIGGVADKIIRGGGGVWGDRAMSAHPQLGKADAMDIVRYIVSLSGKKKETTPVKGNYLPSAHVGSGSYVFSVSYTDKGNGNIPPLSAQYSIALRNSVIKAINNDSSKNISIKQPGELLELRNGSFVMFKNIDLTEIEKILIKCQQPNKCDKFKIRIGSAEGQLIGETDNEGANQALKVKLILEINKNADVYIVFTNNKNSSASTLIDTVEFSRNE